MENPIKMNNLGGTPIFGNIYLLGPKSTSSDRPVPSFASKNIFENTSEARAKMAWTAKVDLWSQLIPVDIWEFLLP